MDSKNLVVANFKANLLQEEVREFIQKLRNIVELKETVDVGIAPALTSLETLRKELEDTVIGVGAQNCHWEDSCAYTGEVSARMLKDAGAEFVILGHSERRTLSMECDDDIFLKVKSVLGEGLQTILCLGESLEEYNAGQTEQVIQNQLEACLPKDTPILLRLIIAYEPVWAIGSGKIPTPEEIQKIHKWIRKTLRQIYKNHDHLDLIPILYGGSVKPDNIEELMALKYVDGVLVGGASLKADSFGKIIEGAQKAVAKKSKA